WNTTTRVPPNFVCLVFFVGRLYPRYSRHPRLRNASNGGWNCCLTSDEFFGQGPVGAGAGAGFVVFENGFAEAGRFAQANGARNYRGINLVAEMLAHFRHDL